jgi:hypothetical protein
MALIKFGTTKLPKLNVVGSIPIARSISNLLAQAACRSGCMLRLRSSAGAGRRK